MAAVAELQWTSMPLCYTPTAISGRSETGVTRIDGRTNDQLRPVSIELGAQSYAEGSALIAMGDTRVLCAVSVENRVPPFLRGSGAGMGDRRVRDAAQVHAHEDPPGDDAERSDAGDPTADRPVVTGGCRLGPSR